MVIVDTSVWVQSRRARDEQLDVWIERDEILQHPFVTAELSMGSFRSIGERDRMIDLLDSFEQFVVAGAQGFHAFVSDNLLYGTGIGFADAHLLHACATNSATRLATHDKRLASQASRLGIEVIA